MPTKTKTNSTQSQTKKALNYIASVGRRKRAVARVRLHPIKSKKSPDLQIIVNNKPIEEYFQTPLISLKYTQPFRLTNTLGKFNVTAKLSGSGLRSQLDALIHGISRALVKANPDHKTTLRHHGLLTRDPRERQRRMIGTGGKARRKKQSPKR